MTDSLVVDPARLKAAGIALRDQVLPTSPPPISAPGSDSVSAAINKTMPIIESPVVEGLPDAQTALSNTGSKIVAAADMYAETDQLLGEHVGAVQFLAAGAPQPADAATGQPLSAAASKLSGAETADTKSDAGTDKKTDTTPSAATPSPATPSAAAVTTNLNQVSAMTQAAQPLTQGLQSVMSGVQQAGGGMGSAGAPPAKPADDPKADGSKKPDEKPDESATADGAAAGGQGSGSVPVEQTSGGRPEATQSQL
jgi:hypothetical protein